MNENQSPPTPPTPSELPTKEKLWESFSKWGRANGVDADGYEEDWLPWWQCFQAGASLTDAGEVGRLKSEIVRLQDQLFVAPKPSEVAAREKQWETKLLAAQSALEAAERERDEAKGDVAELKAKLAHYPVAMMERRDVEKLLRQQLEAAEQRLAEVVGALKACEVVMDTAALHGLPQQLPPTYRESWAEAHQEARADLAKENAK